MKKEDKKVPDAPDRLFVCPFHTGLTSGLIDEEGNQHAVAQFGMVWQLE